MALCGNVYDNMEFSDSNEWSELSTSQFFCFFFPLLESLPEFPMPTKHHKTGSPAGRADVRQKNPIADDQIALRSSLWIPDISVKSVGWENPGGYQEQWSTVWVSGTEWKWFWLRAATQIQWQLQHLNTHFDFHRTGNEWLIQLDLDIQFETWTCVIKHPQSIVPLAALSGPGIMYWSLWPGHNAWNFPLQDVGHNTEVGIKNAGSRPPTMRVCPQWIIAMMKHVPILWMAIISIWLVVSSFNWKKCSSLEITFETSSWPTGTLSLSLSRYVYIYIYKYVYIYILYIYIRMYMYLYIYIYT